MSGRYDGINTLAGIAQAGFSRKTAKALEEANKIYNVKEVIPTIYLVSELSRYKN